MRRSFATLSSSLALLLALSLPAPAAELPLSFTAHQKQELPAKLAWPDGSQPEAVSDWVLLIHGSGAQNMDEDLALATENNQANPFFKYLSDALVAQGFGVMRYDKRSYLLDQQLKKDTGFIKSEAVQQYSRAPITFLLEDARAAVKWLHARYPKARVHLVGHSEGTYMALQLAKSMPAEIQGLGLCGFYAHNFDTSVFEQSVYRQLPLYTALDSNGDRRLDSTELEPNVPVAMALRVQLKRLDLDADGAVSQSEFMAAQFSNLILHDLAGPLYRQDEARYPRVSDILPGLSMPVAFFVGELDNQTPAYHARAVEIANRNTWHKENFSFTYFPGLGHGLDPRTSYEDIVYRRAAPETLAALALKLAQTLKAKP